MFRVSTTASRTLAGCGKTRRKAVSAKSKHYYDHESASWINVVKGQKHFFRNLLGNRDRGTPLCSESLQIPLACFPFQFLQEIAVGRALRVKRAPFGVKR